MFRIGSHVSISEGFGDAVAQEHKMGGTCGQIFVGSPRGWAVSSVTDDEAVTFQETAAEHDIAPWIVHGTYLINLATPKDDLGADSVETVQQELEAAAALDIPYYVFHPGAHTGAGLDAGIENVAQRLSDLDIPDDVTLLLENTAGNGTTVGKRFEYLDTIVDHSTATYDQLGVCLDTCHLHAAGYDMTTADAIESLVDELDASIGSDNVQYLHLNDSKHPRGSEQDEHEHIGEGDIGDEGFRHFINHPALRDKPMVLETPENGKGGEWNIQKVQELRQNE